MKLRNEKESQQRKEISQNWKHLHTAQKLKRQCLTYTCLMIMYMKTTISLTLRQPLEKNLAGLANLLNKSVGDLSPNDADNIVFSKVDDEDLYKIEFVMKSMR